MKKDRKEMKGDGKDMKRGTMFIASVMAAMVLCMGCSGEDRAVDGTDSEISTEAMGTPEQSEEAAQQEAADGAETAEAEGSEVTGAAETAAEVEGQEAGEAVEQEAGLGEAVELEDEEDEWTAFYNEYKEQGAFIFTHALCEAGYDQICLVNGDADVTNYFSVKDGNNYTIPKEYMNILVYVPYIPTKYSCDNENIEIDYWYDGTSEDDFLKNNIQLYCANFEGDDVPVNISVTFEDGSTQEITVYLTRHAE